jgi:hypothetical protein
MKTAILRLPATQPGRRSRVRPTAGGGVPHPHRLPTSPMSIALAAASSVLGKRGAGEEDQGTKRQRTVNAPSAVVFVRGVAGGMSDADLFALWCAPLSHVAPSSSHTSLSDTPEPYLPLLYHKFHSFTYIVSSRVSSSTPAPRSAAWSRR